MARFASAHRPSTIEHGSVSFNGHKDLSIEIAAQNAQIAAGELVHAPNGLYVVDRNTAVSMGWIAA